jgi:hypothetical protein
MVNVADSADVNVRLGAIKHFRHTVW